MEVGIARTKKADHTYVYSFGGNVPKPNLSRMNIEALMDLRDQVDQRLRELRVELQKQLERIALLGGERVRRGRPGGSALKGRKVPPKYRSPSGDTWAGRGARPRWLVAAIKGGKKLDDYLIDKSARKGRKKA
jgi:DNA-binding protein H-NS